MRALEFVFHAEDAFFGVDLDACRDPQTGELTPWSSDFISQLNSYAEVSPSCSGVKIVARGKLPAGSRKVKKLLGVATFGDKAPEVAVYDAGRFWCITGKRLPNSPASCEPRQEELLALLTNLFPPRANHDGSSEVRTRLSVTVSAQPLRPTAHPAVINSSGSSQTAPPRRTAIEVSEISRCALPPCVTAGRSDLVWQRVHTVGKFAERGREYFDRTWAKAGIAVAANSDVQVVTNASLVPTPTGSPSQLQPLRIGEIIENVHGRDQWMAPPGGDLAVR